MAGSEYRVFSGLCQSLGVHVPFTGLSVGEVFDRFRAGLDASRIVFIVVLDEIDALVKVRGDSLLYEVEEGKTRPLDELMRELNLEEEI